MHCWYVCWSSAVSQCTGRNLNSELMSSYIELSIRSSRVNSKLHGLLRWGVLLLKIFIERLNKDINCTYVLLGHWEFHYFKILFNNTYFRIFMWIILYIQNLYITYNLVHLHLHVCMIYDIFGKRILFIRIGQKRKNKYS